MTGMVTAFMISSTRAGSAMRATPPAARMSAGTRSRAMTATAPAASAIFACSAFMTSMMTPPFCISAMPRLTRSVPVSIFSEPPDRQAASRLPGSPAISECLLYSMGSENTTIQLGIKKRRSAGSKQVFDAVEHVFEKFPDVPEKEHEPVGFLRVPGRHQVDVFPERFARRRLVGDRHFSEHPPLLDGRREQLLVVGQRRLDDDVFRSGALVHDEFGAGVGHERHFLLLALPDRRRRQVLELRLGQDDDPLLEVVEAVIHQLSRFVEPAVPRFRAHDDADEPEAAALGRAGEIVARPGRAAGFQ